MATMVNLTTDEAVDFSAVLTYTGGDTGYGDSEYAPLFTIREYPDAPATVLQLTDTPNANGSSVVMGGGGAAITATLDIKAADMAGLTKNAYTWDNILTVSDGSIVKSHYGEIENRRTMGRS